MITIENPVLCGFNPDPSICRNGDDFYIATSTFEWFPGVRIRHSRDLKHWNLISRPLDREDLLNLEGIQSSGGIWAPCLSLKKGIFYLVYTVVKTWRGERPYDQGTFKDVLNFVTTAPAVTGPWSKPLYLGSSGFDPSLFHDEDGRSWLLNMEWDYRNQDNHFTGILMQEYDTEKRRLTGPIKKIFKGTDLGCLEAPHIYKRHGWYYLIVAEGGTSYAHAVTMARSRSLQGPYDLHPENPLLSGLSSPGDWKVIESSLETGGRVPEGFYERPQKAGHASICELDGDEWILAHLSARPLAGTLACPLGRETSLQRLLWAEDDWPRVVDARGEPSGVALTSATFHGFQEDKESSQEERSSSFRDEFDAPAPSPRFMFLRRFSEDDISLKRREGWIRLVGRESPVSSFRQTVMGYPVGSFNYEALTQMDFEPDSFQQMAGLILRYDERNQYYLRVSGTDEKKGRSLGVIIFDTGKFHLPLGGEELPLPGGPIRLRVQVRGGDVRFSWASTGDWKPIGGRLDAAKLSDENAWPLGFSGTFVGLACHDLSGRSRYADFDFFEYREL